MRKIVDHVFEEESEQRLNEAVLEAPGWLSGLSVSRWLRSQSHGS